MPVVLAFHREVVLPNFCAKEDWDDYYAGYQISSLAVALEDMTASDLLDMTGVFDDPHALFASLEWRDEPEQS